MATGGRGYPLPGTGASSRSDGYIRRAVRRQEEALFGSGKPPRFARRLTCGVLAAVALAFPAGAVAGAPIEPYGKHDSGGFRNVLPPAQGTDANLNQILQFEATGKMPPHTQDQLGMYANLVNAAPVLKLSQISKYYKDAT